MRVRPPLLAAVLAAGLLAVVPAHAAPTDLADITIVATDGVNLVGDVHLPSDKGRWPAIVDMEPYGRSSATTYVKDGYAHVNTDVRGSGKSGGALCLLCEREQRDVYDVVEWVARQPWSNGKVVLYGYSYSAITALLGAAQQPPHLTTVVVGHPPTDAYRDVLWHNGLYDQGFSDQWFLGQTAAQSLGGGVQPQMLDRKDQLFAVETRINDLDGPLYRERSVLAKVSRIRVPVYVFTGWHDMYSRGDMRFIDMFKGPAQLWIDASTHHGTGQAGEVGAPYGGGPTDLTPSLGADPPAGQVLRWLDHYVRGVRNGVEKQPRVTFYDLGTRKWSTAQSWRAAGPRLTRLFLSGATSGTARSLDDGSLTPGQPRGRDSYQDSYVYDPTAGISVPMGAEGPDGFAPYVHTDQRIDDLHGLTYTTATLRTPLKLAGPSELRFWALSESGDMAWVARLSDVAPDGTQVPITQGWLRASFRHVDPARSRPGAPYLTDDRKVPVPVGQTTEYRLDIWDTAYTLAPGHRLRLWFASSDSPTHEPVPAAGRNVLFHDAQHPTQLLLGTR
ncbi:MAG: CocE/NonD family hydrolase [Actinomycetota bacterium]|nr:CocE/NonD family hydrolase [Actinomycetota bacterium]